MNLKVSKSDKLKKQEIEDHILPIFSIISTYFELLKAEK